ncbi:MAG TPA: hypothetical protein VE987_16165 [Polyangiaceae bacterium]|nr:hypothetical protein [Polyangiaceae bacterium]
MAPPPKAQAPLSLSRFSRACGRAARLCGAIALGSACASSASAPRAPAAPTPVEQARARTTAFTHVEDDAIGWLAAADPRLALRADTTAPDALLKRIGMAGVLAEDTTAQIRGGSLDLFAFRARAQALDEAAKLVADFHEPLPDEGPVGSMLAQPKLERELLERLIAEERGRAEEEAMLGDASGDLVRGIVSTWTPPSAPQDWPDRDAWVSKHLLEIRDSLRESRPRTGPTDLDMALYPLERLLAPMQFPRGSAAIAEVRMTLDDDMRAVPPVDMPDRIAREAKLHLGVTVDPSGLRARLERIEARLRDLAGLAMAAGGEDRAHIEARARELLLIQRPCPAVSDTRVRAMAPPPEREAICGALRALTEEPSRAPAIVALHDDVLLSFAAVVTTPPLRTGLLSHPEGDDIDALARRARERPVMALGVAFAAELLYGSTGTDERLRAWHALGEAPLDIVERELAH